ncbi:MAG: oxidoreductase [Deltaproteobacteria bacterium]|nr:oxidoreductase [Deltaproteobacteria bacterium]
MHKSRGLIVNIDLCIGCYACEVACKQEHNIAEGEENGIRLITVGPYKINDELAMDFIPIATEKCDFSRRMAAGERPACVKSCPTQALELCDDEEILNSLRADNRFHICKYANTTIGN